MNIDLSAYQQRYRSLGFSQPAAGILEIEIDKQGRLNAADESMHQALAWVWRDIDVDDSIRCVLTRAPPSAELSGRWRPRGNVFSWRHRAD